MLNLILYLDVAAREVRPNDMPRDCSMLIPCLAYVACCAPQSPSSAFRLLPSVAASIWNRPSKEVLDYEGTDPSPVPRSTVLYV